MTELENTKSHKPKIGIALGGAAAKSVFYIGLLEVFKEQNIPIDFIAASSSGTIVASCFATGRLDKLKEIAFNLDRAGIFDLLDRRKDNSGLYSLDSMEQFMHELLEGKQFHDTQVKLAFVAADINKGEQVILSMGDLARACRISCTIPGLLEPVRWGNSTLVDGGLLSVIPGDVARDAGMDIVIGVSTRSTRHIFQKNHMRVKRFYNFLKKVFLLEKADHLWDKLEKIWQESELFGYYDTPPVPIKYPGMFSVLGRSIDLAIEAEKKHHSGQEMYDCDFIINLPLTLGVMDMSQAKKIYELGRKSAEENLPKIKQLIANYK